MDLLLVSRRIGRVYIDVARSDCQHFLLFSHVPVEGRLGRECGEGLTGVEIWKVGESNED